MIFTKISLFFLVRKSFWLSVFLKCLICNVNLISFCTTNQHILSNIILFWVSEFFYSPLPLECCVAANSKPLWSHQKWSFLRPQPARKEQWRDWSKPRRWPRYSGRYRWSGRPSPRTQHQSQPIERQNGVGMHLFK